MAMRLLTKSEIDKAKASQQKREIDEGLKLARRVDNLREVAAQEEASLAKFRRETVAKISAEISKLEASKEVLTGEVSRLRQERKELVKPLDAEWTKVHKENAQLEQKRDDLTSREIMISEKERATRDALNQAADVLSRAVLKDERTADLLADADKLSAEAIASLKDARDIKVNTLEKSKQVDQELAERDMAMAARERGIEMREADLKEREAELDKAWKLLEDRKAMVERRIKKQT